MIEIDVKDNDTGLRVFINGAPDLVFIPKDDADIVITAFELQISEYYEDKVGSNSKITISLNSSNIS